MKNNVKNNHVKIFKSTAPPKNNRWLSTNGAIPYFLEFSITEITVQVLRLLSTYNLVHRSLAWIYVLKWVEYCASRFYEGAQFFFCETSFTFYYTRVWTLCDYSILGRRLFVLQSLVINWYKIFQNDQIDHMNIIESTILSNTKNQCLDTRLSSWMFVPRKESTYFWNRLSARGKHFKFMFVWHRFARFGRDTLRRLNVTAVIQRWDIWVVEER